MLIFGCIIEQTHSRTAFEPLAGTSRLSLSLLPLLFLSPLLLLN